jgi:negative regulator of sigma E activity
MLTKPIRACRFFTLTISLLAANYLFADVATLKRIAEAERNVAYIGLRLKTFSTSRGVRTMEEIVIHRKGEDAYRKIESVVGEQKTFAKENENQKKQDDNSKEKDNRRRSRNFRWERQGSQFSIKEIEFIAQNYELEHRRWGEKIAGHETDLLIIKPKFEWRPTKHIYFARKNNVILRVEDLDAAGVLRNMFVYTRISFDPKVVDTKWKNLREVIKPVPRSYHPIPLAEAEKVLKKKPIKPQYLPPGFQLQSPYKHKIRNRNSIRLKYTDGLLDFNLFETTGNIPNRGDRNRGGNVIQIGDTSVQRYQRGPTHAFTWSSGDTHFFLYGPIPTTELQKVVESIILKTDQK